ncbi:Uncharacterized protein Rs2_04716 [Raphanus sativus]|nr:Uncharacterized protein Rs2_04716 [Raphanus sativus]
MILPKPQSGFHQNHNNTVFHQNRKNTKLYASPLHKRPKNQTIAATALPSHRRPAGITRGGLSGVLRRRTETGGTLLPCAAPPPPSKRYRRDDSGYDGRRGGYGPPDRRNDRFGYENDREMGGRHGYGDERPPGRFMGRGVIKTGREVVEVMVMPLTEEVLKDIKNTSQSISQHRNVSILTLTKRKNGDFHYLFPSLKDKYHLTNLLTVIEKRNEHARKVAKDFLLDLQSGNLDLSCSDSIE